MVKKARRDSLVLDVLISQLMQLREESPLKGGTVVHVCVPDHEYQAVNEVLLRDTEDSTIQHPSGTIILVSDSLDQIVEDLGIDALMAEMDEDDLDLPIDAPIPYSLGN